MIIATVPTVQIGDMGLGAQPSQDLINEFLMNIASRWKDSYQPTVFVGQIQASLGV